MQIPITGAGFGGLLAAVRLLQSGATPDEICIVEPGGGFGGVWYCDRFTGLMCDIESYVYLLLLEETRYVPSYKYAYAPEIRAHVERIAKQRGLEDRVLFWQQVKKVDWEAARSGIWGRGIAGYSAKLQKWRGEGSMKSLEVKSVVEGRL